MNENILKQSRLNTIVSGATSGGILLVGGGVAAAALFFGLGYAGMGLRDLVDPIRQWAKGRVEEILTGEAVVYWEEKLAHAQARYDYWASLQDEATLYSPGYWAATVKMRYWEAMIIEAGLRLEQAKMQVAAAESGASEDLIDFMTGAGGIL